MEKWDVFISHASPDKERFVLPLADALRMRGIKVWLDKWEIVIGASISESISDGLKKSEFGIVVLSPSFFSRAWPKKELGALFSRESDGASHILPIWYQIEYDDVWNHAPLLADRMAARGDEGIPSIVERICRLVQREASGVNGISASDVRALSNRLFPNLPADPFWEAQLLADLDINLFRKIEDIERAYRRASTAVAVYAKEQPSMFRSGTDYLTKALGFVDLCFRSRHNWSSETLTAFRKHSDKVRWEIDG